MANINKFDSTTKKIAKVLLRQVINNKYNPLITYGEVSNRLNGEVAPENLKPFLYVIADFCKDNNFPYLTAIVCTQKYGMPGNGFYKTYFPEVGEDEKERMKTLNSCLNEIMEYNNWDELVECMELDK